ncbi:MAG: hypothetical protein K0Q73_6448 [Paenibacillus sp.]|jgi:hypothetical protein|nr:hypothetical protein [Paenibacillus sp.]
MRGVRILEEENNRVYDGFIENENESYPFYIKRTSGAGGNKEWICVEADAFKQLVSSRITLTEKKNQSLPIMQFKQRTQDNKLRAKIADNLYKAIKSRTTEENREQYLMGLATFYGYLTTKSITNAYRLKSPIPLHAEDIINLEIHFGINRDEILGEVNQKGLSNIRSFQRLYTYMNKNNDLRQRINGVINQLVVLLFEESKKARVRYGIQPEEKACITVKEYIKNL